MDWGLEDEFGGLLSKRLTIVEAAPTAHVDSNWLAGCSVDVLAINTAVSQDLKGLYTRAGVKSEPVLFLFTDSQIADEKFLVFLHRRQSIAWKTV